MIPRKVKHGEWDQEVEEHFHFPGQDREDGPYLNISPTEVKGTGDIQGLENLPDLRYFSISGMYLESIDANIGLLQQLRHLIIEGCDKLQSISGEIGKLSHLETLKISGPLQYPNKLKCLPPEIGHLQSLRRLTIQYGALEELPETIGNLVNLTELTIEDCPLQSLPASIKNLPHLEELECKKTNIKELPPSFCTLTSLKELTLYGNKDLVNLPGNIGNLSNLERLSCNTLQKLPESFGDLRNLREFVAFFSGFSQLPDTFGNLESLSRLELSSCKQLKSLPDSFCKLLNLKSLDLTSSGLESVPVQLHALKNLEELKLDFLPLDKEEMTLYDNIKKANKETRKEQIRPLLTYLGRKYDLTKGFHGDLPKIDALRKQIIEVLDKYFSHPDTYLHLEQHYAEIKDLLAQSEDNAIPVIEFLAKLRSLLSM